MSHPSLPVKSLQDLIRLAKASPGALSYASSGNATTSHLTAELIKYRAGIDLVHIPYKGESPAHTDLMAGRVQLGVSTLQAALPLIRSGKANALGVTSLGRSSLAPDIPTVAEAGLPDFQVTGWLGVCAPAGTPKAIVDRLSREFNAVASLADTRDRLAGQGTEPVAMSSDAFGTWIREETDRWGTVITRARITLN